MSKKEYFLTLDEAIARVEVLKEKAGTGTAAFVTSTQSSARDYSLLRFELARAGAASVYQGVSRGGRPVVLARPTAKPDPLLTIDAALTQLKAFKEQAGSGDIPFLAQGHLPTAFELCDIFLMRSGATNVLRHASRGGQPVLAIVFWAPDKD